MVGLPSVIHMEDDPPNFGLKLAVEIWFPSGNVKVFGVSCQ
jgi:hypothetical protein